LWDADQHSLCPNSEICPVRGGEREAVELPRDLKARSSTVVGIIYEKYSLYT